jgi:outer membrane protein assembly factor BamB
MRTRYWPAAAVAVVAALAGCASGGGGGSTGGVAPAGPSSTAGPAAAGTDWTTYHGNAARTGDVAGLPKAGALHIRWSRRLGASVYGQPLIIGGTVVAVTEGNSVYGLSRATGKVRWRARLSTPGPAGKPCGNLVPVGITGTPVYDRATGLVYAVADHPGGRKVLAGIRISNGKIAFRRAIATPDHQQFYDQQRAALTVSRGRVYVAFGGHFGDCGPYRGSVVGVPVSGKGKQISYVVPTKREAGIWASGGPVVGPRGTIYVASGNGAATRPPFDGSDSVISLSPALRRTGVFAPRQWASENAGDVDLGSSSPALVGNRILQTGKSGTGYLLNAGRLGGVGGQLASGHVCAAFGGPAVSGKVVYVPCVDSGLTAVSVAGGHVRVLWRAPGGLNGSPVVGGGAVWVANWDTGVLYELGKAHGRILHKIGLGSALPHFVSPSLSGGLVLVGTMHGVVAVSGA